MAYRVYSPPGYTRVGFLDSTIGAAATESAAEILQGTEPIMCWRAWAVAWEEGTIHPRLLLKSVTYKTLWYPGKPLEATCESTFGSKPEGYEANHEAPYRLHDCGIYGVKSAGKAKRWGSQMVMSGPWVYGKASLWGRILLFEHGYRAQYGYPYEILVPEYPDAWWENTWPYDGWGGLYHDLRKHWAVDVATVPWDELPEEEY